MNAMGSVKSVSPLLVMDTTKSQPPPVSEHFSATGFLVSMRVFAAGGAGGWACMGSVAHDGVAAPWSVAQFFTFLTAPIPAPRSKVSLSGGAAPLARYPGSPCI